MNIIVKKNKILAISAIIGLILALSMSGPARAQNIQNKLDTKNLSKNISDNLSKISTGMLHSLAIGQDGNVYSWGNNINGQLGIDEKISTNIYDSPQVIKSLQDKKIISVAAGPYHSLALSQNGDIYGWGRNDLGQAGIQDTSKNVTIPTLITISNESLEKITSISSSGDFSLALNTAGEVYSWGSNIYGQLGMGSEIGQSFISKPHKVAFENDSGDISVIKSISSGYEHSMALGVNGELYSWGRNNFGQLGSGRIGDDYNTSFPNKVGFFDNSNEIVKSINAGGNNSNAITAKQKLFTWGRGWEGQVGNGNSDNSSIPVDISTSGDLVKSSTAVISAGYFHALLVDINGSVYGWGYGYDGQLGNGLGGVENVWDRPVYNANFVPLGKPKIVAISAGFYHSLAIDENGRIYAWGNDTQGQLGIGVNGNRTFRDIPVEVNMT